VRIVILGVGDAFTSEHFGSSALIETSIGRRVLIDCPDPIHRVLREGTKGRVRVDDIDDIVLTHIHGDHTNGLESFGFWRWMKRQKDQGATLPRVWTNPWTAERLWRKLSPAMSGEGRRSGQAGPATRDLATFFDVRTIEPGEGETAIAGLTVRARWTTHPIPTMGLLISENGKTLGWASDTAFERAHIDWLAGADVIVHEANTGPAHTPIEDLNALPGDLRKKMRLIHLPDDFDPSRTDVTILREGDVLEV
jgi:ribonuclease BN (tRNA processing enzyme)